MKHHRLTFCISHNSSRPYTYFRSKSCTRFTPGGCYQGITVIRIHIKTHENMYIFYFGLILTRTTVNKPSNFNLTLIRLNPGWVKKNEDFFLIRRWLIKHITLIWRESPCGPRLFDVGAFPAPDFCCASAACSCRSRPLESRSSTFFLCFFFFCCC